MKKILLNQRAAIDLASIMVGIIVIGLIGGIISATVFAVIPWAQDNAAKQSLLAVKTAQNAHAGLSADPTPKYATSIEELESTGLLSGTEKLGVATNNVQDCFVAVALSDSGRNFWVSDTTNPEEYIPGKSTSDCVNLEQFVNEEFPSSEEPTPAPEPTPTPDPSEACFEFKASTNTITGYKDSQEGCGKDVVIPSMIDGVAVTSIGEGAFDSKSLTSVVIPDSVTRIGREAFYRNALTNIVFPDSVTNIGTYAFSRNKLTSVIIPDNVTIIGAYAFRYNALTSAELGNSVTSIGQQSFSDNALTSVFIPDSVTTIGKWAFAENPLTSVSIRAGLTYLAGTFPEGVTPTLR